MKKKYEYEFLYNINVADLEKVILDMSDNGWRLCAMVERLSMFMVVFEREVK